MTALISSSSFLGCFGMQRAYEGGQDVWMTVGGTGNFRSFSDGNGRYCFGTHELAVDWHMGCDSCRGLDCGAGRAWRTLVAAVMTVRRQKKVLIKQMYHRNVRLR